MLQKSPRIAVPVKLCGEVSSSINSTYFTHEESTFIIMRDVRSWSESFPGGMLQIVSLA